MIKVSKETFLLEGFYNAKSIKRAKKILSNFDEVKNNMAYSEVDTVIYIKNGKKLETENLIGKQIYIQALYVKSGNVVVEWDKKDNLKPLTDYDMIKDKEEYQGPGKELIISNEEVVMFDLDEAVKIKEINSSEFMWIIISKYGGIK